MDMNRARQAPLGDGHRATAWRNAYDRCAVRLGGRIALNVALVVVASGLRAARADEGCPPAAVVTGDRELARDVGAELRRRGVAPTTRDGCSRVTATVSREGELVRVDVTDGYGRSRTWRIQDVGTASALIDSWTRQEADEGELPPDALDVPPAVVPAAVAPPPMSVTSSVRPAPRTRGGVSVAFETSLAAETSWSGGAIDACVRVGAVCAGGRVRGAQGTATQHDLTSIDLLAIVELPIGLGAGFTAAPGAAVGLGWTQVTTDDPHAVAPSFDVGGVRLGGRLSIARPIVGGIGLELSASFDGVIAGHDQAPAALPDSLVRVGVGLRYGRR